MKKMSKINEAEVTQPEADKPVDKPQTSVTDIASGAKNLSNIVKLPYADFILKLKDQANDGKLQAAIKAGGIDGKKDDEKITFEDAAPVDVKTLHPTQNEIDMDGSLYFPLSGKSELVDDILKGTPVTIMAPVVILNNKWIIDGHHRWSQVYAMNKDGKINCMNMKTAGDVNPITILKAVQMAIATVAKDVPMAKVEGTNLMTIEEQALKDYVISGKGTKNEDYKGVSDDTLGKIKVIKTDIDSKEKLASFIWDNILSMRKTSAPAEGAPKRDFMPQTDGTKETPDDIKKALKSGAWKEPLTSGSVNFLPNYLPLTKEPAPAKKEPVAEPVKDGYRWIKTYEQFRRK